MKTKQVSWSVFKGICDAIGIDNIDLRCIPYESEYSVYLFEANSFNIETVIDRNPTDSTDLDDFEDNYLEHCNKHTNEVITPTSPKNEYDLKPYGVVHKHIDSSDQVFSITLSNKSDTTYDYSCSEVPQFYDCITQDDSQIRDEVYSVDTESGTVTTFSGNLVEGSGTLIRPINIDFQFPTNIEVDIFYMWGVYFSAEGFGEDDLVRLQIIDDIGVGVALGLYTQQEFEAMGSEVILKEYDECWVNQLNKIGCVYTPDGAPGEIYAGLKARIKYYAKDATKTNIKVWGDYIITIKS